MQSWFFFGMDCCLHSLSLLLLFLYHLGPSFPSFFKRNCIIFYSTVFHIGLWTPTSDMWVLSILINYPFYIKSLFTIMSSNSKIKIARALWILMYTRLKVTDHINLCRSFQSRSVFHVENTALWIFKFS